MGIFVSELSLCVDRVPLIIFRTRTENEGSVILIWLCSGPAVDYLALPEGPWKEDTTHGNAYDG
jgi:hypothetical protein